MINKEIDEYLGKTLLKHDWQLASSLIDYCLIKTKKN